MKRDLTKIAILICVTWVCLYTTSNFVNKLVIEATEREQTIADAIIKQQVQQTLEKVQQEIEIAAKEEHIIIEAEPVEILPPIVEEPKEEPIPEPIEEIIEQPIEEIIEEIIEEPTEEPIVEEIIEEPIEEQPIEEVVDNIDAIDEKISDMIDLIRDGIDGTEEVVDNISHLYNIGEYLVEHYFLDGFIYVGMEQDPDLKARKQLAHQMECYIIESLNIIFDVVENIEEISITNLIDLIDFNEVKLFAQMRCIQCVKSLSPN